VIGTLLGVRSEEGQEVEVRNCFAVGHTETQEQVEVDMDYQKQMLALHLKANPKEVLVGWYATSAELNTFSALIQNFYGGQGDGTWPHPAVHLTVSTEAGKDIETRTYISAPVGVTMDRAADSAAFIPVPHEIRYGEPEKSGLELISGAKDMPDRTANVLTDIETLERAIEEVLGMLDRVSKYVEAVIEEEAPPSSALGQFLLNALALAPKVDPADIERDLYVPILQTWRSGPSTDIVQQQPYPRRVGCLIPRKHRTDADRSLQQISNGSTDHGRWRWFQRRTDKRCRYRGKSERGRKSAWWKGSRSIGYIGLDLVLDCWLSLA
jgi:hypothetical protein